MAKAADGYPVFLFYHWLRSNPAAREVLAAAGLPFVMAGYYGDAPEAGPAPEAGAAPARVRAYLDAAWRQVEVYEVVGPILKLRILDSGREPPPLTDATIELIHPDDRAGLLLGAAPVSTDDEIAYFKSMRGGYEDYD